MRPRAALVSIVSSAAVLVIGWQLGTQGEVAPAPSTATATQGSGQSETFTGDSVSTRFGSVQVAITVSNNTVTDVTALDLTDADRKSVQISNRAEPILRKEVLASQSASVDAVSGATYTSDGYLTSLQSALDQAGL